VLSCMMLSLCRSKTSGYCKLLLCWHLLHMYMMSQRALAPMSYPHSIECGATNKVQLWPIELGCLVLHRGWRSLRA
jgi:hypothetical protein